MKRTSTILAFGGTILLGTALIYGCGDDDDVGGTSTSSSSSSTSSTSSTSSSGASSTSSSSGAPDAGTKPPALGAQIDRFGRPAINTAVNKTFEADAATHDLAQDEYNQNGNKATWSKYVKEIAGNLAIYDALDTTCGNQAFASKDASADNVGKYGTLAGVLADDRQWLNTAGTTSAVYLAVELNATGAIVNTDQGGRKLSYDVIDTTYNVVGSTIVDPKLSDGVTAVAGKTAGTTFPYLAEAAP